MISASFDDLLKQGLRPVKGHLFARKHSPHQPVFVEGVGTLQGLQDTKTGLLLLEDTSSEQKMVDSNVVRVAVLGDDPAAWHCRFNHYEVNHATDWAKQKIERGTILFVRAVAQVPMGYGGDIVQLRYDDIAGIGVPKNEEPVLPCYPAPSFILVKLDSFKGKLGSLYLSPIYEDALRNGASEFGTVVALPRDSALNAELPYSVGDRVVFSRHNLSEFIDLDGGYRLIHIEDVLGIVDNHDNT